MSKVLKSGSNANKLANALIYVEDLYQKVEELKAELEEIKNPQPTEEAPPPKIDGLNRDASGKVIVTQEKHYEERMAERRVREEAADKELWRMRTEGLPEGVYRTPDGLLRDRQSGQPYHPEAPYDQDWHKVSTAMKEDQAVRAREAREMSDRLYGRKANG